MLNFHPNILAVVNHHVNNENTLAKTKHLAELSDATVTLLNIEPYVDYLLPLSNNVKTSKKMMKEELRLYVEELRHHGVKVVLKSSSGLADYGPIIRELNHGHYDMVIKEKSHHHYNAWGMAPCCDWLLLRHCSVPVMFVTSKEWQSHGHIVAAVETEQETFSHQALNNEMLSETCQLSELLDSQVHLLNCYDSTKQRNAVKSETDPDISEKRLHWRHLVDYSKGEGAYHKRLHLKHGEVEREVSHLASEYQVNLVVLGTNEHHNMQTFMHGHTSEHIIDKLDYDVLAIKPRLALH